MENTFRIKDKRVQFEIFLWAKSYEMMILWMNALKGSIERIEFKGPGKGPVGQQAGKGPGQGSNLSIPSSPEGKLLSSQSPSPSPSPASPSTLSHPSSPSSSSLPTTPSTLSQTPSKSQSFESSIIGHCQCNAIQFSISSQAPITQGYCHCTDCQQSSSAPFTCLLIFPSASITLLKGNVFLGKYPLAYQRNRYFCRQCSSYLMFDFSSAFPLTESSSILPNSPASRLTSRAPSSFCPMTEYTAVLCGAIPDFPFEPSCHVMYCCQKMSMHDGLPKYRGYPPSWGGKDPTEISEV